MQKKTKFKPKIRKVRLNPEQAVLSCICYSIRWQFAVGGGGVCPSGNFCTSFRTIQGPGCHAANTLNS